MNVAFNRRQLIGAAAAAALANGARPTPAGQPPAKTAPVAAHQAVDLAEAAKQIRFSLNMSTIRGQKLALPEQVNVAAKAGYDAIEPWIGELHQFAEGGGNLSDLKKRISDAGLTVESA